MANLGRVVGVLPTTDARRAPSFFEGRLGLKFVSEDQFALVLEANRTKIRVAKVSHMPPPYTVLGWE
jgi:hypothetical protein